MHPQGCVVVGFVLGRRADLSLPSCIVSDDFSLVVCINMKTVYGEHLISGVVSVN